MSNSIEEKVEKIVKPIINKLNYELYDVQYLKEGKDFYLRITIDKENGISIQDCEKVNEAINDAIDNIDFIKESYYLEISSPGLERTLRKKEHFIKQLNQLITVKLFQGINSQKEFVGKLIKYDDSTLQIETDEKILEIDIKNIAIAKKYFDE